MCTNFDIFVLIIVLALKENDSFTIKQIKMYRNVFQSVFLESIAIICPYKTNIIGFLIKIK